LVEVTLPLQNQNCRGEPQSMFIRLPAKYGDKAQEVKFQGEESPTSFQKPCRASKVRG
jgi:hypothetical protein